MKVRVTVLLSWKSGERPWSIMYLRCVTLRALVLVNGFDIVIWGVARCSVTLVDHSNVNRNV